MANFTSRLALQLPGGGSSGTILPPEPVDIDVINENMRKLDDSVGAKGVTSTTRPTAPYDGQISYETDTGNTIRYNQGTTTWDVISRKVNIRGDRFSGTTSQGVSPGIVTVPHGLGVEPKWVSIADYNSGGAANTRKIQVSATSTANIQFYITNNGTALGNNPVVFYWSAGV